MRKTLIVCESTKGGVDKRLITSLINVHNLHDNFDFRTSDNDEQKGVGSIEDVKELLKVGLTKFLLGKNFENLLVIVDADEDGTARFQEIDSCLDKSLFKVQNSLVSALPNDSKKINTGIFLFPDNRSQGSLETLCLNALDHQHLQEKLKCVDDYMECIDGLDGRITENNKSKAKFRIFIATPNPDRYVDSILDCIDMDSGVFNNLKSFIQQAH